MTQTRQPRRTADERRALVLDTAERLFRARGVHAVGMDELIAAAGLAKMSVYRLFPTKDALVGAYLTRLADGILALIDADATTAADPRDALVAMLDAIAADLRRPDFRGCPFGNAAAEFEDAAHPARTVARDYRRGLRTRLGELVARAGGPVTVADQLAVIVDGAYLNAAHLGPDGPAAAGLDLARALVATLPGPEPARSNRSTRRAGHHDA
ncbi:MAG: TetR/AcrR family transcriptional regulator [Jatrophihabitans sp.]|uniref:TetR/AcrR family transcriptional regulator n=1 Tax=Jatrophihabitans sp. TaxID=1932789 RepID=UPI003F810767